MPVIALCGIKHSGKSTIGRILGKEWNIPFDDLDALILKKLTPGWTIRKWYRERGKQAFMDKEMESLEVYLNKTGRQRILALGGGTLENPLACRLLKTGKVVLFVLDDEEKALFQRIMRKGLPPFLEKDDPAGSFHRLYERRRKVLLDQGNHIIDTRGISPENAAGKVSRVLRRDYGWE